MNFFLKKNTSLILIEVKLLEYACFECFGGHLVDGYNRCLHRDEYSWLAISIHEKRKIRAFFFDNISDVFTLKNFVNIDDRVTILRIIIFGCLPSKPSRRFAVHARTVSSDIYPFPFFLRFSSAPS